MKLTADIETDCLVSCRSGVYADTVETLPIEGDRLYLEDGILQFWNDCTAELIEGEWLRIGVGDTRMLLCPSDGDAALLSENERQTNLVIYTAAPSRNVTSITAQAAVLCCDKSKLAYVIKAVPQDLYPVCYTANETAVVLTRGKGDITLL
jgi:hypothetical protein